MAFSDSTRQPPALPRQIAYTLAVAVAAMLAAGTEPTAAQEGDTQSQSSAASPQREIPPPEGQPLTGEELDTATYLLADKLRCPVCQGLSVAASPSPSALAMREEIRDLFALGYTEDQIVVYFEGAYGEFVRLIPTARGFNVVVWILPVAGLLVGLLLVWRFASRQEAAVEEDEEDLDTLLEEVRRGAGSVAERSEG